MTYAEDVGERSASYLPPTESERVVMASGTIGRFIATRAMTAGRFGLYEWNMPSQAAGATPHFHKTFSESFFVLSGTPRLYDGTRWVDATPGSFLYVPERGVHGFSNESDEPAAMLILFAPGAPREDYFRALEEIGRTGRTFSAEEWAEFLARHDQYEVG